MKKTIAFISILTGLQAMPVMAADNASSDLPPPHTERPLPAPPADKVAPLSPPSDTLPGNAPNSSGKTVGKFIDDATITARIKAKFVRDSMVKATSINVETSQGAVQLSGFVKTETEKTRASEIARDIPGVKEVHNDLIVQAPTVSN